MANKVEIEVPYEGDQELRVTDVASLPEHSVDEDLRWVLDTSTFGDTDAEMERIMRGTMCLFHSGAGSFAECLHQAIVWERG